MKRCMIALGLAALLSLSAGADPKDARTRAVLPDPAGDITGMEGDPSPADVVNVELSSDGEFVVIAVTLAEVPKPTSLFHALLLGVAFDVDRNAKSGGQGFGGMHGDVPGIDFESEVLCSVDDGAPAASASASVFGVDANGNQSSILTSSDAPATPAKGKVYTGRIAYSSLQVKPGQTIRVIARELNDKGAEDGLFPEVLLTLR